MIDSVRAVADAILYEGFMLFPYTPSSLKNQSPWQFGVVMPEGYSDESEPSSTQTQFLCRAQRPGARIEVTLRFLQILDAPEQREVPFTAQLCEGYMLHPFETGALHGAVRMQIVPDGAYFRVTLDIQNETVAHPGADRTTALRGALVSAHAIVAGEGAEFISLLDPPQEAKDAVSRCRNRRVYPVLAGPPGKGQSAQMLLASPIILYDFPAIAQASRGQTFDATEIDELLLLSVASLSDEERRQARGASPMTAQLVERAEALDAETLASLHGRLDVGSEPGDERIRIGETIVERGSRVRVHPKGRTDVFDSFVEGKTARVTAVHTDFDGQRYVGVVFDDDPASEIHEWYGRAYLYTASEVEPL